MTTHPEIAKDWHPTKNGNIKSTDVMAGSKKRVWWKCKKCGYEWEAVIRQRVKSLGKCPKCSKKKNKNQFEFDFK